MNLNCLFKGHQYKQVERYSRPYHFEGMVREEYGVELVVVKDCQRCGKVRSWKVR